MMRITTNQTRDALMCDYESAYKAANGRTVQIDYFAGWFSVYAGGIQTKCRASDIERMTAALKVRA